MSEDTAPASSQPQKKKETVRSRRKPLESYSKPPNKHRSWNYKERDPATYKLIIDGLKAGNAISHIATTAGVANSTVSRIRWEMAQAVDEFKANATGRWAQIVEAAQRKTLELLPQCTSAKDASVVAGIGTEKTLLGLGAPTSISRQETVEVPYSNDWLAALPTAKVVQVSAPAAQVIDVESSPTASEMLPEAASEATPRGEGVGAPPAATTTTETTHEKISTKGT